MTHKPEPPSHLCAPLAAFLSYLVPGLGQIYQGRIGKGLLFFCCLYGLFFYGMHLGNWSNVYLLDATHLPTIRLGSVHLPVLDNNRPVFKSLGHRPQFAAQFWIGVAAWPAVWQFLHPQDNHNQPNFFGKFQLTPSERDLNLMQRHSNKAWDLAWVYTVIAGVLNVLVIYDAFAGPAFTLAAESPRPRPQGETA